MEELKRFQGSAFDEFSRKRLIEDRDTILELTAKIQELQLEINCMNDSRDFQDAESERSGHSHVASQPVFFPPFRDLGGMLSRSIGMPSRSDKPPDIWDTHGSSGNVLLNPTASSSAPYPQGFNPWISTCQNTHHRMEWVNAKHQTQFRIRDASQDRQPEIHSTLVREDSQIIGAEQQRLQISDFNVDKFPCPATFVCWKIWFKTEVCTCSQILTEAVHWIKEVEMVESVDDLKSSCSVRGIQMPNLEVLDAKIATESSMKPSSQVRSDWRNEKPKKGPFPSWRTDLRVLPGHWSQRFCRELCRPIYKCSSKWRDYHKLLTMVKRSVEQNLRTKNFEARNGNYETAAMVKNGTKQRGQRNLGDCWHWETNGQCVKGDNCNFRHDMSKHAKATQPWANIIENPKSQRKKSQWWRMSRWPCKDCVKGSCNNSLCERWHPPECLFHKSENGCTLGKSARSHIARLMISRRKGPKRLMTKVLWLCWERNWQEKESVSDACHDRPGEPGQRRDTKLGQNSSKRHISGARQLGCVFQDITPPKSILRKSTDMPKPIQRVKFQKAIARHTKIRHQNPSVTFVQVNLMSVAPTLRNLRIVHKKRQSGKSKVPAKQRGSWPKMC